MAGEWFARPQCAIRPAQLRARRSPLHARSKLQRTVEVDAEQIQVTVLKPRCEALHNCHVFQVRSNFCEHVCRSVLMKARVWPMFQTARSRLSATLAHSNETGKSSLAIDFGDLFVNSRTLRARATASTRCASASNKRMKRGLLLQTQPGSHSRAWQQPTTVRSSRRRFPEHGAKSLHPKAVCVMPRLRRVREVQLNDR